MLCFKNKLIINFTLYHCICWLTIIVRLIIGKWVNWWFDISNISTRVCPLLRPTFLNLSTTTFFVVSVRLGRKCRPWRFLLAMQWYIEIYNMFLYIYYKGFYTILVQKALLCQIMYMYPKGPFEPFVLIHSNRIWRGVCQIFIDNDDTDQG